MCNPDNTDMNLVIFIFGSTATGKTKLSVELAKRLGNAEIVSADSIQACIYRHYYFQRMGDREGLEMDGDVIEEVVAMGIGMGMEMPLGVGGYASTDICTFATGL